MAAAAWTASVICGGAVLQRRRGIGIDAIGHCTAWLTAGAMSAFSRAVSAPSANTARTRSGTSPRARARLCRASPKRAEVGGVIVVTVVHGCRRVSESAPTVRRLGGSAVSGFSMRGCPRGHQAKSAGNMAGAGKRGQVRAIREADGRSLSAVLGEFPSIRGCWGVPAGRCRMRSHPLSLMVSCGARALAAPPLARAAAAQGRLRARVARRRRWRGRPGWHGRARDASRACTGGNAWRRWIPWSWKDPPARPEFAPIVKLPRIRWQLRGDSHGRLMASTRAQRDSLTALRRDPGLRPSSRATGRPRDSRPGRLAPLTEELQRRQATLPTRACSRCSKRINGSGISTGGTTSGSGRRRNAREGRVGPPGDEPPPEPAARGNGGAQRPEAGEPGPHREADAEAPKAHSLAEAAGG